VEEISRILNVAVKRENNLHFVVRGEKKTVNFLLGPRELGFYSQEMKYVVEPGVFKVWVAWNSFEG